MKYFLCGLLLVAGCAGPIALDRAIEPAQRKEFEQAMALDVESPKSGWLAWKALHDGITLEEARKSDATISTTKNPFNARRDPDAVSRGALIFEAMCARCHGDDARGHGPAMLPDHPAKDFHSFGNRFAVTVHGGAPRTWFRKIREGYGEVVDYPGGATRAMPPFENALAREQIWLVVTYLQSLDIYARPRSDDAGSENAKS